MRFRSERTIEMGYCGEHVYLEIQRNKSKTLFSLLRQVKIKAVVHCWNLSLEEMTSTGIVLLTSPAGSKSTCLFSKFRIRSRSWISKSVRRDFGGGAPVVTSGPDKSVLIKEEDGGFVKPWKDAASLILAAPSPEKGGPLQFLIMKRSKENMFLPNSLCFPGGQVAPIDFDMDWIKLYEGLGGSNLRDTTFLSDSAYRPLLYGYREREKDPRKKLYQMFKLMPLQVSFRLAAIRETFEEVGILLCKRVDKSSRSDRGFGREAKPGLGLHANFLKIENPNEVEMWQGRVRSEPKGLLEMCGHYGVLPDLNALVEWNNWMTPNSLKPKRFDTIFYMATVPVACPYLIDGMEVASARWSNASDVLSAAKAGKTRLIPPQIYELTRLQKTPLEKLQRLMRMRLMIGIERWCPCYFKAKDGILSVLPGDDLYPDDYKLDSFEPVRELESTIEEVRASTSNHHRIEFRNEYDFTLLANVTPKHGQVYYS